MHKGFEHGEVLLKHLTIHLTIHLTNTFTFDLLTRHTPK